MKMVASEQTMGLPPSLRSMPFFPLLTLNWAGICPGNNETAGRRKSGTTRKGNRWARKALCEAAWAASKTKATYLQAQFRRSATIRGNKRAIIAVASRILVIEYHVLQRGTTYQELGGDYFDKRGEAISRFESDVTQLKGSSTFAMIAVRLASLAEKQRSLKKSTSA